MDLPKIYDTLRKDVANHIDGIDASSRRLRTEWGKGSDLDDTAAYKVRVNDETLGEDLDEYHGMIEQYNLITETATELAQENAPAYLDEARHSTSVSGKNVLLSAGSDATRFTDNDTVRISRWIRANQDPIVEAESAEELRENLYEAATDTGHGPVYEALDETDIAGEEGWHNQLWDLVTDDLEGHDGEKYSVQSLLEDRQETANELTEMADGLHVRLTTNLEDELREYRPSTGTRLRRTVRKLF